MDNVLVPASVPRPRCVLSCAEGSSATSLFGSEKKRTIPIKATV